MRVATAAKNVGSAPAELSRAARLATRNSKPAAPPASPSGMNSMPAPFAAARGSDAVAAAPTSGVTDMRRYATDLKEIAKNTYYVSSGVNAPVMGPIGMGASGLAGVLRTADGVTKLTRGVKQEDLKEAMHGVKEVAIGSCFMARMVRWLPRLGPLAGGVGYGLAAVLTAAELKSLSKKETLEGEMNALGWSTAMASWAIPVFAEGAIATKIATALGLFGGALLAFKDIGNLWKAYSEKNKALRAKAIGGLVLDAGVVCWALGSVPPGYVLYGVGLLSMYLYGRSSRFRRLADQVLDKLDRSAFGAIHDLGLGLAKPFRKLFLKLRDQVIKPAERKIFEVLIDKPARAIARLFRRSTSDEWIPEGNAEATRTG